MMDEARIEHIKAIDIPAWQFNTGDWFTIHLFHLWNKADEDNTAKLSVAFPEEYEAFKWWQSGAWEESRGKYVIDA